MTVPAAAVCDRCRGVLPASELYVPYGAVQRCKDEAACERRQLQLYDPTIQSDDDRPVPPPPAAAAGAVCDVCGAASPAGSLYERTPGVLRCRNRGACEQRQLLPDLGPQSEDYPEAADTGITGLMHAAVAAGAEIPPERTPLTLAEIAVMQAQEALGRKRY